MDINQEELLKEVMANDFTVIDLHLYLDTHPQDINAISLYNNSVQRAKFTRENYERAYGPISSHSSCNTGCSWQWIESPWPWEK